MKEARRLLLMLLLLLLMLMMMPAAAWGGLTARVPGSLAPGASACPV